MDLYVILYILFKSIDTHKYLPGLGAVFFAHNTGLSKLIHDPGSSVKANLEFPL